MSNIDCERSPEKEFEPGHAIIARIPYDESGQIVHPSLHEIKPGEALVFFKDQKEAEKMEQERMSLLLMTEEEVKEKIACIILVGIGPGVVFVSDVEDQPFEVNWRENPSQRKFQQFRHCYEGKRTLFAVFCGRTRPKAKLCFGKR